MKIFKKLFKRNKIKLGYYIVINNSHLSFFDIIGGRLQLYEPMFMYIYKMAKYETHSSINIYRFYYKNKNRTHSNYAFEDDIKKAIKEKDLIYVSDLYSKLFMGIYND